MSPMDELVDGDGAADTAYRWTVRVLYAVAIGLNVYLLWDTVADDTDTQVAKAHVLAWKDRILRPFHIDRQVQRETGPLLWEATQIVEDAQHG